MTSIHEAYDAAGVCTGLSHTRIVDLSILVGHAAHCPPPVNGEPTPPPAVQGLLRDCNQSLALCPASAAVPEPNP